MDDIIKKYGWWKIVGGVYYISGILGLVAGIYHGTLIGGVILGVIDLLIGRAFTRESLLVFRIVRVLLILSVMGFLLAGFGGNFGLSLVNEAGVVDTVRDYLSLFSLATFVMLWKDLRKKNQVKW